MRTQAVAALTAFTLGLPAGLALTGAAAQAGIGAKGSPRPTSCSPKTTGKAVAAAFNQYLAASAPVEKVAVVDQGAKVLDAVAKNTAVMVAAGRDQPALQERAVNVAVVCAARTAAHFTFDLQLRQATTGVTTAPLGVHQPGDAVLKKGAWYLTALTVCAFLALNPDPANEPAVAECHQAVGRAVPTPTT